MSRKPIEEPRQIGVFVGQTVTDQHIFTTIEER